MKTYVKVKVADGYCLLYGSRLWLDTVLWREDATYEVLETYKGKDLEYKEYEPLFDCAVESAKAA